MNPAPPQSFNGCRVGLHVDGEPALGVLFGHGDAVSVVAVCFEEGMRKCPMIIRDLSPAEIETLAPCGHRQMTSAIALFSDGTAHASMDEKQERQEEA